MPAALSAGAAGSRGSATGSALAARALLCGLAAAGLLLCFSAGRASGAGDPAVAPQPPARSESGTPGARQLIVVSAAHYGESIATLTAYEVRSGTRRVELGPWVARIGLNGFAPPGSKREGDGRTPSGTFAFQFMFGVRANPGVHFAYRRVHDEDMWDDDPASPLYNEWVDAARSNPGTSPEAMYQTPAYDYGAAIGYNAARVPGLGSAIFLHVSLGAPTSGCVSLPRAELLRLLRWMTPAASPRIRMGVDVAHRWSVA